MTFSSVYQMLHPLTTVRKQHMWDWFEGLDLGSRWSTHIASGTPVFQIADAVDEGFEILTDALNEKGLIAFNNKRQYDFDNVNFIAVAKRVTTDTSLFVGLQDDIDEIAVANSYAVVREDTSETFKELSVSAGDSTNFSTVNSDVAIDTNWTAYFVELTSSSIKLSIDGVLKVTNTTTADFPNAKLQPIFQGRSRATGTKNSRLRYFEAYNT